MSFEEKDLDVSIVEVKDASVKKSSTNKIPKKKKSILGVSNLEVKKIDIKRDFMYISKNYTFNKIQELLDNKSVIICDLHDRDGKIGLEIIGITNSFTDDDCIITMKGGIEHRLLDKFLYNIIYNTKKDEYYLEEQDEYFEKILTKDED